METQVPIKRKSSRKQPELQIPMGGMGGSNITTYVAIGAAGLALGLGYICMKKIQQQQTTLTAIQEKDKQFETFQNQIKQLEENNQTLYKQLQKSDKIQNKLGEQFNSITHQLSPQRNPQQRASPSQQRPPQQRPPQQRQRAPDTEIPDTQTAAPKPTRVEYVEPLENVTPNSTTRIVLSPEDKI